MWVCGSRHGKPEQPCWVEEGKGDLVISDVIMPDGNGLDALPRISKLRPGLPVIVIDRPALPADLTPLRLLLRELPLKQAVQNPHFAFFVSWTTCSVER